jgi:ribosomal protein L15E
MWRYESLEQRAEKRTALFDDPAWLGYVAKIGPMIIRQRNAILHEVLD